MAIFNVYWKLGGAAPTPIEGNDIADAFQKAGYGGGILGAVDYYEEAKEVPLLYKEVVMITGDKREELGKVSNDTIFVKQLLDAVERGEKQVEVSFVGNVWQGEVEITGFEVVYTVSKRSVQGKQVYPAT